MTWLFLRVSIFLAHHQLKADEYYLHIPASKPLPLKDAQNELENVLAKGQDFQGADEAQALLETLRKKAK